MGNVYQYEYPRAMVTADALIFLEEEDSLKVLLIKRGNEPFKGSWAVPGGFMDMDETLERCAERELFEETGLKGISLTQMHVFDDVDRDPRGRLLTAVYIGFTTPENCNICAGDDADEAEWFNINSLPDLAFDHDRVVQMALDILG